MIIITKNKKYYWNYKRLFKNLGKLALLIFFIASYLVLSKMDFNTIFER